MNLNRYLADLLLGSEVVKGVVGDRVFSLADTVSGSADYITFFGVAGAPQYDWGARYATSRSVQIDIFTATGANQNVLRNEIVRLLEEGDLPARITDEAEGPKTSIYRYTIDVTFLLT